MLRFTNKEREIIKKVMVVNTKMLRETQDKETAEMLIEFNQDLVHNVNNCNTLDEENINSLFSILKDVYDYNGDTKLVSLIESEDKYL